MRIAWSIGHYPESKGAYYPILDAWEHDIAISVVECGKTILVNKGYDVIIPPTTKLGDKIAYINAHRPEIAIESHFNASGNESAKGCEVLYFSIPFGSSIRFSMKGKKLAEHIQFETLEALNSASVGRKVRDRGAKGMADIRRVYNGKETIPRFAFLMRTNMPAVIVEPLFLTNYYDAHWLTQDKEAEIHRIAMGVVNGVLRYDGKSREPV